MNIAQIVPNWTQFHPENAIGIKAVVRDVSLGLTQAGHKVTVFAPDGSTFPGITLRHGGPSLRDQGLSLTHEKSPEAQKTYAQKLVPQLHEFDVVHSHIEHVLLPFIPKIPVPVVSTIHGAAFQPREVEIFKNNPHGTFVALSRRATVVLPYIKFSAVVYNGVNLAEIPFVATPQEAPYAAWLGRYAENKGALDAIEAAKQAGLVITLVGFEQKGEEAYFKKVKALEDGALVRLLDAMIGHVKYAFLGNARAFLFPIHWEEPFGLVMVEAMACGTPVIAFDRGSVSEIVKNGVTGFVVPPEKGVAGLVDAINRIGEIDRASCRKHVEDHFTTQKMVEGYEAVYQKAISQ